MGPGAYHFGATYVGNKQMGPNEVTESAIDVHVPLSGTVSS